MTTLKDKPESNLSADGLTLWTAILDSVSGQVTRESKRETILFHAALPSNYVRLYKISLGQWLSNPISSWLFQSHRRKLSSAGPDERQTIEQRLDDLLLGIEFGTCSIRATQRWSIRSNVLDAKLPRNQVKSAMRSCTVVDVHGGLSPRRVPDVLFVPAKIFRDLSWISALALCLVAAIDFAFVRCLSCGQVGSIYLAAALSGIGYLSHILGPQWRQSEVLATRLLTP